MLRCLAIGLMVARHAVDGQRPVQFRPLCLCNPASGTRLSFAVPFHPDAFSGWGGITAASQKPAGTLD
jgi:hypothetical protein